MRGPQRLKMKDQNMINQGRYYLNGNGKFEVGDNTVYIQSTLLRQLINFCLSMSPEKRRFEFSELFSMPLHISAHSFIDPRIPNSGLGSHDYPRYE